MLPFVIKSLEGQTKTQVRSSFEIIPSLPPYVLKTLLQEHKQHLSLLLVHWLIVSLLVHWLIVNLLE